MREETLVRHLAYPCDVVWDFLADLRNDPLWRREIQSAELVAGTARESDAEYVEHVMWEGIRAEASLTTPKVARGEYLMVFARDPGYESKYAYDFIRADGGCEVRLHMCIETFGPLRLIEPFMWAIITRWVEQSLRGLDGALAEYVDESGERVAENAGA